MPQPEPTGRDINMAERLLLVDDNPPDRIRYRHMLRRAPEGYDIVEAATGTEALEMADGTIDCIVLDQDLPDISGLEVLDLIQKRVDPPVVVMLTGEEDAAVSVDALKRGASDYLMKRRIDEDNLFRAVRGALERGRLESQVRDQQRRLALFYRLASQTDDALFIIDPATTEVTECNNSARSWLGAWPTIEGAEPFVPSAFGSLEEWRAFLQIATDEGSARIEWALPGVDGGSSVCEIVARMVEEQGAPYVVAVGRDVTVRVENERALFDQTQHDALTGILNRRAFEMLLRERWAVARRTSTPLTVLMIDVDVFKAYNDGAGHQAGDECLRAVATALASVTSHDGIDVARYGGEEFVAVLPIAETAVARAAGEQLRAAVEQLQLPHPASPVGPFVTVSIGAASRVPEAEPDGPERLVAAADEALYEAKRAGRNRVVTALPF